MSLVDRWRRLDASRWVSVVLVGLVLWMAWQTLRVAFLGWLSSLAALLLALVPAALAAAGAVLAAAWRREREWAWFALVVLCGLHLLLSGGLLLRDGPSVASVLGAAIPIVLLVLAVHPDSRSRLQRRARPTRPPSWRVPR